MHQVVRWLANKTLKVSYCHPALLEKDSFNCLVILFMQEKFLEFPCVMGIPVRAWRILNSDGVGEVWDFSSGWKLGVNLGWLVMEEEMSASFIIYAEHY